ncbi:EF-hand domain-containing protein [Lysobacter sp. 5GHs7-4]|uniref:HvfA family oxazolone/thioamide-modified RiPP metallophore n=1 Tax=Lysobacter sp. 5GHs7-4 TaxID=2904253 RepID=UPI001E34CDAD|nr:EF-hand domain-containing protein [Lysobacter sp. 5GHs7-4]UHQ21418.1 EF-hand domain-containing protein [Lysobacter sp. 5GHs7-4]
MSSNHTRNTVAGALGIALTGLVLSGSAFAMQPLAQGYMLATGHAAAEGKCGEGKCGAGAGKTAAGKKTAEGKCGEGQCGDARFAATDTDDDGRVSRAEFLKVVPKGEAAFKSKDSDRNGYISEHEAYYSVKAAFKANGKDVPRGLFSGIDE